MKGVAASAACINVHPVPPSFLFFSYLPSSFLGACMQVSVSLEARRAATEQHLGGGGRQPEQTGPTITTRLPLLPAGIARPALLVVDSISSVITPVLGGQHHSQVGAEAANKATMNTHPPNLSIPILLPGCWLHSCPPCSHNSTL